MNPTDILLQALKLFGPIIAERIREHHARTGALPTDDEVAADLEKNVATLFAEGRAWKATHPSGDPGAFAS